MALALASLLATSSRSFGQGSNHRARAARPPNNSAKPTAHPADKGVNKTPELSSVAWTHIMSSPHISSRMVSLAVDPHNPRRMFIGTQSGTVLRSSSGGLTWDEVAVAAFPLDSNYIDGADARPAAFGPNASTSLGLDAYTTMAPWLPRANIDQGTSIGENWPGIPIREYYKDYFNLVPLLENAPPGSDWSYFSPWGKLSLPGGGNAFLNWPVPEPFLSHITSQYQPPFPINAIKVCPGSDYDVLVAAGAELLGSNDNGNTFIPIWFTATSASSSDAGLHGNITRLECVEALPNDYIVMTTDGSFHSGDSGVTFEKIELGDSVVNNAVYGPGIDGRLKLYVSTGGDIWVTDADDRSNFAPIFPDNEGGSAPCDAILWMSISPKGIVWAGTDEGIRWSDDNGKHWHDSAASILGSDSIPRLAAGPSETGQGERVVVAREIDAYLTSSADNGASWAPFFGAESRRTIQDFFATNAVGDYPARWWALTSGELWATGSAPTVPLAYRDAERTRWANEHHSKTMSLLDTIRIAQFHNGLLPDQIAALIKRYSARALYPTVELDFTGGTSFTAQAEVGQISNPYKSQFAGQGFGWTASLQLAWVLPDLLYPSQPTPFARQQLHELSKRISFTAEDAWRDRKNVYDKLANEPLTKEDELILKARLESLDALIDTLTGVPTMQSSDHNKRLSW